MKKILTGMLALSLLGFVSMAFSQKIPIDFGHTCPYGQKWSEEQGECVSDTDEHGCLSYQQWDETQGKCVVKPTGHFCKNGVWDEEQGKCVSDADEHGCSQFEEWNEEQGKCEVVAQVVDFSCFSVKCDEGSHCENGECVPDTPTEPEEPEVAEPVNLPALEHFTLEESSVTEDEIYLVFAPKGTSRFFLHVYLYNDAGRDILETYCTGDESLCKAVGNGADCADEAPTGSNSWCYAGAD